MKTDDDDDATLDQTAGSSRRRCRDTSTFDEIWNRGPTNLRAGNDVPPAAAHAMTWFHFIMRLCRTRPIPRRVREDPSLLAKPLARATGWSHSACLAMVTQMTKKSMAELRREGLDPNEI